MSGSEDEPWPLPVVSLVGNHGTSKLVCARAHVCAAGCGRSVKADDLSVPPGGALCVVGPRQVGQTGGGEGPS